MQDVVEIVARTAGFALAASAALYGFACIAHIPSPPEDDDEMSLHPIEDALVATGDILLFRGRSPTSTIIRTFSHCQWTHVGIAVRRNGRLYILHSDPKNGCADHFRGDGRETYGVQLNDLHEYARKYEGDVYVRQLRRDDAFDIDELERVMDEVAGCLFADSLVHKARSAVGATAWVPRCQAAIADDGKRRFFCSELAAYVLARCGMLDAETTDVRTYHPGHFAPDAEIISMKRFKVVLAGDAPIPVVICGDEADRCNERKLMPKHIKFPLAHGLPYHDIPGDGLDALVLWLYP